MNKNIILDTAIDTIMCNACQKLIEPGEPKIITGFPGDDGGQEYRVFHTECVEDPDR